MTSFKYSVSFRIYHPSMDPEQIFSKLSLTPEISWKVGDKRTSPKGKLLAGKNTMTYLSQTMKHKKNMSLAECLKAFTLRLKPHSKFLNEIRSTGGRYEYFIGWFSGRQSGETFDYELLSHISYLQIDIALDVYGVNQDISNTLQKIAKK